MHELSLMQNVLQTVELSAEQHHICRINKVKLVIGQLTMALPDSLLFAFEALKPGTIFANASLVVEEQKARCQCRRCRQEFELDEFYGLVCPQCGNIDIQVQGGDEMYVDFYEGE
ncbi:MAG: hydrogenase maturation nickel metallochaperone HypA [Syntrophomonadaceae bacterium]|jgi:hydrogenase nickel incorporation protein HypA/HybF